MALAGVLLAGSGDGRRLRRGGIESRSSGVPQQTMRFAIPMGADERVTINGAVAAMLVGGHFTKTDASSRSRRRAGDVSQIYLRSVETGEVRALPGTRNAPWSVFFTRWSMARLQQRGWHVEGVVGRGRGAAADTLRVPMAHPGCRRRDHDRQPRRACSSCRRREGRYSPLTKNRAGRRHASVARRAAGRARRAVFDPPPGPTPNQVHVGRRPRSPSGERRDLVPAGTAPGYAPTGHLVYAQTGTLYGVPFDLEYADRHGQSRASRAGRASDCRRLSPGAASRITGTLVYVSGAATVQRTLVWVARDGTEQALPAAPHEYDWPRLSPDGKRVAVEVDGQTWVYDIARDTLTRLTFDGTDKNDGPLLDARWNSHREPLESRRGSPPACSGRWPMAAAAASASTRPSR